jgi:hypothetical protein
MLTTAFRALCSSIACTPVTLALESGANFMVVVQFVLSLFQERMLDL